ncbi:class I SAM-dependent methyltransferase [Plantactinospora sp. CA-290183]|uniref:class I SAM-dependent methyltransferase n=1 Tax=Plantactinospora sp. CA-290183 TaxID=3240006 RepID=UPI003D938992
MNDSTTRADRIFARHRSDGWTFLTEAARDLRTVGAVAPSGRILARALTAAVGVQGHRSLSVLEAGAGTGAVTRALIAQLAPGSHLDIVDANPRFAERLRHLVHAHPLLAGRPEQVHVHEGYVEHLKLSRCYDVIVSGLPLTNFTPHQVETIMDRYLQLLHAEGTLTYFAYLGTRPTRILFASRAEARRHQAVDEIMSDYQRRYGTGCETVWGNVPPARVWRLRRPSLPSPVPPTSCNFVDADR